MSIFEDFNYINKIMLLKESGFNVIENVPFEIIDNDDTTDSSLATNKLFQNSNRSL